MKTNIISKIVLSFLIICFGSGYLFPQNNQTGTLFGRVTASDTKEALPFASVLIVGTNKGSSTDWDGKFFIRNIPEGKQEIRITYVGYEDTFEEITIQPDRTLNINIAMQTHSTETKERSE